MDVDLNQFECNLIGVAVRKMRDSFVDEAQDSTAPRAWADSVRCDLLSIATLLDKFGQTNGCQPVTDRLITVDLNNEERDILVTAIGFHQDDLDETGDEKSQSRSVEDTKAGRMADTLVQRYAVIRERLGDNSDPTRAPHSPNTGN